MLLEDDGKTVLYADDRMLLELFVVEVEVLVTA